ncbi:hypothetical protein TELCIR_02518 [Teladorsagia circumcincta]|uniref:Uncharacterized protein n=1 Tax=Teladorsagia circumcincta TaxID=45464 RepID=A0A2G9UYZ6_TELCI|nr:hypothetical protein TELCIR_02518 [Teladorsagia circumcincta]
MPFFPYWEAVLRPLFKAATILDALGPRAKQLVASQMPEECQFLVEMEQLQNIINGTEPEEGGSMGGGGEGMEGGSSNSTMEGGSEGSSNSTMEEGSEGSSNSTMEEGGESGGEESGGSGGGQGSQQSISWIGHPLGFPTLNQPHQVVVIATKPRFVRSPNSRSEEVVRDLLLERSTSVPPRSHDSRDSHERLRAARVTK